MNHPGQLFHRYRLIQVLVNVFHRLRNALYLSPLLQEKTQLSAALIANTISRALKANQPRTRYVAGAMA